jgi:hypothetical protein
MEKANWTLNLEDANKGYLKETREYIYKLKTDLIQKILSSAKKNQVIEVNSIRYNQK